MWMAMMSMLVARCGNVANWFLSSWSELMRNRWDATIVMIGERLMSPTMGTVRIVAGPRFPMKVFNTKQWRDPKRQQSNWRSWDKVVMAFSRIKHICSGLYNRIREIGNFQRRLGDSDRSINRLMMESSIFSSTFDSRIWLHLSDGTLKKFLWKWNAKHDKSDESKDSYSSERLRTDRTWNFFLHKLNRQRQYNK